MPQTSEQEVFVELVKKLDQYLLELHTTLLDQLCKRKLLYETNYHAVIQAELRSGLSAGTYRDTIDKIQAAKDNIIRIRRHLDCVAKDIGEVCPQIAGLLGKLYLTDNFGKED